MRTLGTKWPQELHELLVAEPGTSLALSLTVITVLQFHFYFCKLLTMKRPILRDLQALWIPNSAHLSPRKTRGKWCWAHIACKHGSFLLLNFMVSTPWSRIYISNRRMKEVQRGGKTSSQHPVRESYWKLLCGTEVWAELVRTLACGHSLPQERIGNAIFRWQ